MALVFDPHQSSTDMRNAVGNVTGAVAMAKACNEWLKKIIDERRAQGVPEMELFSIPVASRIAKEKDGRTLIRRFNVAQNYPGKINNMEQLLIGPWRLATAEEVEAEKLFHAEALLQEADAETARIEKIAQLQQLRSLEAANRAEKVQRELSEKRAAQVKQIKKDKEK